MTGPVDALLAEFANHYSGDELPLMPAFRVSIPSRARASAARLRAAVGDTQLGALGVLLRELAANSEYPLHGHISNNTMIHWPDEADTWAAFGELAARIVEELGA